ncbi:MAG: hypothetical protein NT062_31490 [Proteobacteria bacterium]|nr:hypothetical protein [Pseudomonadota bacterium]
MRSLILIALLAACGDDGNAGPRDAPPITPDIDNGSWTRRASSR